MKWYRRLVRYPEIWVLGGLAVLTRLWQIGWPPAVVFDEVYFRTFASNYLSGNYFFDVHPPLVKLLFAGVASLFNLSPLEVTSGDPGTTILRVVPALAGAALVPLVYVILRQVKMNRRIATLGGIFILFDNALLVESRFVLMDSLLLLAGFGALSAYLALRQLRGSRRWLWVVVMAVLFGMVASTKWSGLAMVGLVGALWLVDGIRKHWKRQRMASEAALTLSIMALMYVGSFMLHFSLLTHSGEGDAFMSERFQSTLIDGAFFDAAATMPFADKFVELNQEMYAAQNSLSTASHPYASSWYTWPFMVRPIYYWQGELLVGGAQGNVYLLGNPIVWLLSIIGAASALIILVIRRNWLGKQRNLVACLLLGYGLNMIPFAFINRPMFLYHYLFAFILSILITCVVLGRFFDWQAKQYGKKAADQTLLVLIAAIVLGFLYFLPLTYGWPMSPTDLQKHVWLPTWR